MLLIASMFIPLVACQRREGDTQITSPAASASVTGSTQIVLTSSDFQYGGMIPRRFTCDGEDVSPSLRWSPVPKAARSLALIVEDPNAPGGRWVHWLLYN
ncbi:MAG: YbhB/YbcL family Raf kinase inhibitor-like protein, partial [Chloroflexota bacterium]|nr:YbhB/YbcL family Raf kinase inhibitor-like protein [Chloroflexota bacterium]